MSGRSQHYIPASFLGRFSHDSGRRMRERLVWALQQAQPSAQLLAAERLGAENNLYKLFGQQTFGGTLNVVDDVWAGYERRLIRALDELSNPRGMTSINATTWLRTLVPFVASLFVRGKEFRERFQTRLDLMGAGGAFGDDQHRSDNVNMARLIEFQRLLAPTMAARWVVMHTDNSHPVITSELGFTFSVSRAGDQAIVVPVGPECILAVVPTWPRGRVILRDGGTGQWRAQIERVVLQPGEQIGFNRALANMANDFLAGPTRESVELHRDVLDGATPITPEYVGSLWPSYRVLSQHQLEWYNAVSAISKKSSELSQPDLERRIAKEIAKDWHSVLIWPMNAPYTPTGLSLEGDQILLTLPS